MINIIIPCYNCRETLPNTLHSLVAQTQKRFMVTLVQDGNEPFNDISDIEEDYSDLLNIKYIINNNNVGPGLARQRGIESNNLCEYITFLDSDDMMLPYAIEIMNRETQIHKPDVLITDFVHHSKYEGLTDITGRDANTWLHGKVYRAEYLANKYIHFPIEIKYNEDAYFNTLALNLTKNIYTVKKPTVLWIDNSNSITRSDKNFSINCIPEFIEGQALVSSELVMRGRHKQDTSLFAKIINNIYKYYQKGLYYKVTECYKEELALKNFFLMPEVISMLENKEFQSKLIIFNRQVNKDKSYPDSQTLENFIQKYYNDFYFKGANE